jgi:carboxypeptidase Taq
VNTKYTTAREELLARLHEIDDLGKAGAILNWDQSTYMPPQGAEARAHQMATLEKIAHARRSDPELGKLLDQLEPELANLDPNGDDAAMIRVARRDFDRATRIPAELVGEIASHLGLTYNVWTQARPADDFAHVQPYLEKTLELSRRYAQSFEGYGHLADPLIDGHDEGMTVATIRPLFAELRQQLSPLVKAIAARPDPGRACLRGHFPKEKQWAFGEAMIRDYGYDFTRGRQDLTHHPFMTRFGWGDCRITTKVYEDDLGPGLFATLHEAGHALYELGIAQELDRTPLGEGTSSGVHESQSRTWENIVGRSRPVWEHYFPKLQQTFPDQLMHVDVDTFYRAINRVQPSLIRIEADEVTYNLHVIIRFELECELLEGSLAIADLPRVWRERYGEYLGVESPDDRDGVLQDVHWYGGLIGGQFQGYTVGNILAGMFYQAALAAKPQIPGELAQGNFSTLHTWLKENIYRHGRKLQALELVRRITGGPIRLEPYLGYLNQKYGELYSL